MSWPTRPRACLIRTARPSLSRIAGCAECRANWEALREVTATLRADVSPPMPDAVAHRLSGVVAAESAHRAVTPATGRGNGASSSGWQPPTNARYLRRRPGQAAQVSLGGSGAGGCGSRGGRRLWGVRHQRAGTRQRGVESTPFLAGVGVCPACHRRTHYRPRLQHGGWDASAARIHRVWGLDACHRGDGLRGWHTRSGPVRGAAALRHLFGIARGLLPFGG